jgi:hypothetical protein
MAAERVIPRPRGALGPCWSAATRSPWGDPRADSSRTKITPKEGIRELVDTRLGRT